MNTRLELQKKLAEEAKNLLENSFRSSADDCEISLDAMGEIIRKLYPETWEDEKNTFEAKFFAQLDKLCLNDREPFEPAFIKIAEAISSDNAETLLAATKELTEALKNR